VKEKMVKMIDVSEKPSSKRVAVASGEIMMGADTLKMILEGNVPKGDVLTTAKIAGIMAAKKVPDIIPLCHPLEISGVDVEFAPDKNRGGIIINSTVSCVGRTGVEMEAIAAVSAAALTIYDMCKMVDKEMVISNIMLIEKKGGKSGHYKRGKN
jgi:cyclic pyranopterin phosphate synthase